MNEIIMQQKYHTKELQLRWKTLEKEAIFTPFTEKAPPSLHKRPPFVYCHHHAETTLAIF